MIFSIARMKSAEDDKDFAGVEFKESAKAPAAAKRKATAKRR